MFLFEGHCLAECKISEAAAALPVMSEADMLRIVHGW